MMPSLLLAAVTCLLIGCSPAAPPGAPSSNKPTSSATKVVFIHHSCGENWLSDANGGLGRALAANNFFVSDTNYGWGPDGIGDRTDITDWPEWFTGTRSEEYLRALFGEREQHCQYTRGVADPGGENEIVMFKSCFPNSNLEGHPSDKPARGEGLTIGNAKSIYIELLKFFATRPDKLFIVVTAPPVRDAALSANARAFNRWLAKDWLSGYTGRNVAVFDFYNVLTGPRNHHRMRDGKVEYVQGSTGDTSAYPSDDDHPSAAGNRKATEEFVPLLVHYHKEWVATRPQAPAAASSGEKPGQAPTKPAPLVGDVSHPAEKPEATRAEEVIDGFESDQVRWTAFLDTEKNARLAVRRDTKHRHSGAGSLGLACELRPESWALCGLVYDRTRDWSGYQGLSFYVHSDAAGQPMQIIAYGGSSADALLHFECTFQTDQTAVDGWQRVDVRWPQLRLPEWQGDTSSRYDARAAWGVAIGFSSSAANRTSHVWIDDVKLISAR